MTQDADNRIPSDVAAVLHDEHCRGYECNGYRCEVMDAIKAALEAAETRLAACDCGLEEAL